MNRWQIIFVHVSRLNIIILVMSLVTSNYMTALSTSATTLSKEIPSALGTSGLMNQSADEMDIDVSVDPKESLPLNGTQQISTKGATDIDINNFPPRRVTVVIENETVYVTNWPVTIG